MAINLGLVPIDLTVTLVSGSDFVSSLVSDSAWPDGITISLVFGDDTPTTTWTAAIDGDTATWDRSKTDVAGVIAAQPQHARLIYRSADGSELVWGRGPVRAS